MVFSDLLLAVNELVHNDFQRWVFEPGMRFKSVNKWWGDLGRRDFPHEGVDFCLYENASGKTLRINPQTRIPLLYDGVVRHIFPDYLGYTLVIEHVPNQNASGKTVSIYAHTAPVKGLAVGVVLKQGDVIATLADTRKSKTTIHPHLHYTLCEARADIDYREFAWNDMRNPELFVLRNPLKYFDDVYV